MDQFQLQEICDIWISLFIYYQISDSCRYAETIDQCVNGLKIKAKFVILWSMMHDKLPTRLLG